MNQEELAQRIRAVNTSTCYTGSLSAYAVQSIELGRSNYPVQNLISYCQDRNLKIKLRDMATLDIFIPTSVLEVHKVLDLLMKRWQVDTKLVYRKTGVHYTPPKSFDEEELKHLEESGEKYLTPLSIRTLLAVCEVIHCDVLFTIDEKQCHD